MSVKIKQFSANVPKGDP